MNVDLEQYKICQSRGHTKGSVSHSNSRYTYHECQYCGVSFYHTTVTTLHEVDPPKIVELGEGI